ncbi:MAG: bifunctional riboflavin kinase/FAD synthetase [Tissierellia bacterium]|nr:bifunctional riboflavin kinase/FAD synthetase [Tissierellia bacterium]
MSSHQDCVIALGNFDGLHYGHQALMEELQLMKEASGCEAAVLMFTTHTSEVTKQRRQSLIQSNRQKERALESMGIDVIYEVPFTKELMAMEPEVFLKELLLEKLQVRGIVVGFNYRFGHKARGNTDLLRELQKEENYLLTVVDPVRLDGREVSSTRIRGLIEEGRIRQANTLLGRPFAIEGEIVHGKHLGSKLGVPTANMKFDTNYVHPRFGVYLGRFTVEGKSYYSATNIGTNPTFKEQGIKVESYLLDFEGDIYGKWAELELLEFLRPELAFDSVEELIIQMNRDIERAESIVVNCKNMANKI